MNLAGILFLMMIALIMGKRGKKFGGREYRIAIILALLQMGLTVYKLMTMPMPPLF